MTKKEMNENDKKILQGKLKQRRLFLDLTYQDLADKTGLSKSTLQRYETGGIKNLPYDKIFILSDALEVNPNYFTDLSQDYTGESNATSSLEVASGRMAIISKMKEFEERAIQQITPALISNGYAVEQCDQGSVGDLIATKGPEVWHIDFIYNTDVNRYPVGLGMGRQQLLLRFGRLAVYDKPITKYSITAERREIAEHLIQQIKPLHLDIKVSVLLIKDNGYEELFFNQES